LVIATQTNRSLLGSCRIRPIMLNLLGAFLLFGSLTLGYLLWIRPIAGHLDFRAKGLLLLVILTLAGAFFGSIPWWFDVDESFSWNLPPLASRMLAAAAWAFVAACLFVLYRPTQERLRLILLMLAVYLAPLVLAIMLFHIDRFDFSQVITWGFFLIAGTMSVAALSYLVATPTIERGETRSESPSMSSFVGGWFLVVALLAGLWGSALFVADDGFSPRIWVWPGDALTSRLIGVMLLTIAASAVWGFLHPGSASMVLVVVGVYGIGVALANVWSSFLDKPVKESYVLMFGLMGVISLALLVLKTTHGNQRRLEY
jgi:hypothetical protein